MGMHPYFYNKLHRKYIALFGSFFDDIKIKRPNGDTIIVPLAYSPTEKDLAKRKQDPTLEGKRKAFQLPRMGFEITTSMYDPTRKLMQSNILTGKNGTTSFAPAPYNIDFTLYAITQTQDDGFQIVEQILPFFQPELTRYVELIPGFPAVSVPTSITSWNHDDTYEGAFEERRSIIWTFTFTMKAWIYGPVTGDDGDGNGVIKFIDIDFNDGETNLGIQPGLTEDGRHPTCGEPSIPYQDINEDDDYGILKIVTMREPSE